MIVGSDDRDQTIRVKLGSVLIQVGLGAALRVCKNWIDHNHRWVTSMKIESGCSRELVNKNSYVFHRHDLEMVF